MFDRKAYNKQWKLNHPGYDKQWRLDHPEHVKQYAKQWYLDHPGYNKQHVEQWCLDNPEYIKQWRLDHKEEIAEYFKQWKKNNPRDNKEYQKQWRQTPEGKASHQRATYSRRIKLKEITNTLTAQEWVDILKQYKFRCAYCGKEFTLFDRETRDHVIPISKGGDNTKGNIVPACQSCNSKKHNKILK